MFEVTNVTRRGIIFPQFEERGLQTFFPGVNPGPPFLTS